MHTKDAIDRLHVSCQRAVLARLPDENPRGVRHHHKGSGIGISRLEEELQNAQQTIRTLRLDLARAVTETENASLEYARLQCEKDSAPGALLFFAALQDEGAAVPMLQQLALQLSQLKGLVERREHMDFAMLTRRVQVCVDCVPVMQRFLSRFASMHYKWTQDRIAFSSSRHQNGVPTDITMTCPLCNVDGRFASTSTLRMKGLPLRSVVDPTSITIDPSSTPKLVAINAISGREKRAFSSTDLRQPCHDSTSIGRPKSAVAIDGNERSQSTLTYRPKSSIGFRKNNRMLNGL